MTTLPLAGDEAITPCAGSANKQAAGQTVYSTPRMALLAIYAVIPLSLIFVAADYFFWQGRLRSYLPNSPEDLFLFLIFFNLPHIMASAVTFCDRDYVKRYGSRILPAIVALTSLSLFFPTLIYSEFFFGVYYVWTMIHFSGQQCGVLRMMGGGFGRLYACWRWMVLLFAVPIYFDMFSHSPLPYETRHIIHIWAWAALTAFLLVSALMWRRADSRIARYYLLATMATAIAEVSFYRMGYYFFVILITRVIHDLSAFTFYISHDANRNAASPKNGIHRALRFLPAPAWLLCPLVAMVLALPLTWGIKTLWAYHVWMPIVLFHYYTDGFVWKKGSLHREYIRMR